MTTKRDDGPATAPVEVFTGPRGTSAALTYVAERFGALQRYAHRPITLIDVRVIRPNGPGAPRFVEVGAILSVGGHLLRVRGAGASLASAADLACYRLRRQLANLPPAGRGDHVPHPRTAR